ncbi:1-Cys peroxiredoxin [Sesamum angolense]|uniref:thioredoxin-dependent peroxiredoxin n=1 Tax=Sesamum angolense TaxID=2727404 RepID=A0AAE2C1D7_9LAMI|nr:1-Cys peroxiredoxin [Sesamum angolense]
MPGLTIGDTLPDLELETTHGKLQLHDFVANNSSSFTIIFSHPGDFTPVCTTELGMMAAYADIEAYNKGHRVNYPIAADPTRRIIKQLNMVDPDEKDSSGQQTPSRALHIVGPDKKIKLSFLYPASTGRNMDEVLRVVDSLQKAAQHKIATPANWKPGIL